MTCPARPDPVAVLRDSGPLDTETISRRLRVTVSGARRVLGPLEQAGTVAKRKIVTPRHRMGVFVWFVSDEVPERIEAAVAELKGRKVVPFNNRPFR